MSIKIRFFLVCLCLIFIIGCGNSSTKGSVLLGEGKVTRIDITSNPGEDKYFYSLTTDKSINQVIDYLSNLNLISDFSENPDEYIGATWIISLEYDTDSKVEIYHFGNMFIRADDGSWYKMKYKEAEQFDTLLAELEE